jgi:methylated-DNA-[protein]-cysteine S-methyltransferase
MAAAVAPDLELVFVGGDRGVRAIEFRREPTPRSTHDALHDPEQTLLAEAARQLRSYFAGELRGFDLPLDPAGTEFQLRVWRQLETIPYGGTRSYSQIAEAVGSPKAVRAVGAANGANPIAIVIPCHRVIGSSGKLVGYGGGLPLKQRLLALERGAGLFD